MSRSRHTARRVVVWSALFSLCSMSVGCPRHAPDGAQTRQGVSRPNPLGALVETHYRDAFTLEGDNAVRVWLATADAPVPRHLTLNKITPAGMRLLAASPRVRGVEGVAFGDPRVSRPALDDAAGVLQELASSRAFRSLRLLDLSRVSKLDAATVKALAASPVFQRLTGLGLHTHEHAVLLVQKLPGLRGLLLSGDDPDARLTRAALSGRRMEEVLLAMPVTAAHVVAVAGAHPSRFAALSRFGYVREIRSADAVRAMHTSGLLRRLEHLGMGAEENDARALVRDAELRTLRTLRLINTSAGDALVRALAAPSKLGALRVLDLSDARLTPAGVKALAAIPALQQHLTQLTLGGNTLDAEAVRALRQLKQLRTLDLERAALDAGAIKALTTGAPWPRLATLRLSSRLDHTTRFEAAVFPALRTLDLWQGSMDRAGMLALLQSRTRPAKLHVRAPMDLWHGEILRTMSASPHFRAERYLRSPALQLSHEDLRILGAAAHPPDALSLWLHGSKITAAGLRALLGATRIKRMQLRISKVRLGVEEARALASSPGMRRVRALRLEEAKPTADALAAFASSPHLGGLLTLSFTHEPLRHSAFGDAEARQLATIRAPELYWLELGWGQISDGGFGALLTAPGLKRLARLDLQENKITGASLGGVSTLTSLRRLDLSGNQITPSGMRSIAASLRAPGLRIVELRGNPIGDEGVRLLTTAKFSSLREVNLTNTKLTVASVRALAKASWASSVRVLMLGDNALDDEAVKVLAGAKLPGLEVLDLSYNKITRAGAKALAASRTLPRGLRIYLRSNAAGTDMVHVGTPLR